MAMRLGLTTLLNFDLIDMMKLPTLEESLVEKYLSQILKSSHSIRHADS